MRADAGPPIQVKAHTRKRPAPKPKVSAPASDAAQGYGLKRAAAFKKTPQFQHDIQAAGTARVKYQLDRLKQAQHLTPVHHDNIIQSVLHSVYGSPSKHGKSTAAAGQSGALTLGGPVRAATQVGAALALHPVSTTTHTVSGLTKDALNLPGGLLHVATQSPIKTLKQIGADYAQRYGQSDVQMRHRFEKQGVAPEVLDALTAYGGVGTALGKAAKGSELMSAARPALRTGGGAAKAQEVSSNLFRVLGQRQLDKLRAHNTLKAAGRASYEADQRAPAHVITAAQSGGKEVAPLFARTASKAQRHGVAVLKSRAVQMLKSEQHRRIEQHARPIINGLNRHERNAFYAVAEGWAPADPSKFASPAEFKQAVTQHLTHARATKLATRQAEGIGQVRKNVDEVRKIDHLLQHVHESFTPKVAQAVRDLRPQDIHVGRNDPALTPAQRLLRRYGAQANHLGLERGVTHLGEDSHLAQMRAELRSLSHDDPRRADLEARIAASQVELDHLEQAAGRPPVRQQTSAEHAAITNLADAPARHAEDQAKIQNLRNRESTIEGAGPAGHLLRQRLQELEHEAAALRAQRDAALKGWRKHRTADPSVSVPPLRYQGEESVPNFIRRVQAHAADAGLERPLYFPHEGDALANNPDFASHAVGGARAVNAPKRNEYKLFNRGTRDTSPQVYLTGLARSIKRKHNWNLVADQFDHNVLPGLTNMTLGQLHTEARKLGMDPKDLTFWNAGRFRRALKDGSQPAHLKPNRYGDNTTPAEEFAVEQLQHAMTEATHPSHELAQTRGWSALPKHSGDEIMAAAHPSGKLARSLDIMNGKQSRALLGLNPAWNAFQVMSNTGLGALATQGRLPLRLIQQKRLYDKLSPEAKDRFDALVGEGAGTHGAQVHLGATAKGRVVGKYRNFKSNPFFDKPILGVTPRQANPLEAGFAFDRFQNKHFRRAVLLDDLKKQAKNLTPPKVEQMLRNPAQAERAAEHLNNWLGDYTTYTHAERMGIKKGALFYGYLRHSLNVLLRTLPRDHPVMTSILGKVGQLQQDELKKLGLSGVPWAGGRFYFTKNGQLQQIDLGRANPVANAVTQIHGVKDLLGLTQPAVQIAMDQLYHHNSFKDQSWAVGGRPGSATANLKGSFFDKYRARILANQIGELFPPYRVAEKMTEFGPQGADSLPWSQRPTKYKRADIVREIRKQTAQDRKNANLLYQLAPFLPQPSHDVQVAQSIAAATGKSKAKHKSKTHYFGTSSSRKSKHYFTGN